MIMTDKERLLTAEVHVLRGIIANQKLIEYHVKHAASKCLASIQQIESIHTDTVSVDTAGHSQTCKFLNALYNDAFASDISPYVSKANENIANANEYLKLLES